MEMYEKEFKNSVSKIFSPLAVTFKTQGLEVNMN
jgi:hypothetical protein